MRHARPSRTAHGRAGNILVMFAVGLFGLLALAALIIDVGLVILTRRQMQTAVNTAAMEGLRPVTGTYSQATTTVTVTVRDHGMAIGDEVVLDFTSGTAIDGTFIVATVSDANTFSVTHGTSASTLGRVSITNDPIRRRRTSNLVAAVFDDNLDPSDGDEMNFGAGPKIIFDDEPTDIPLPETNYRASRLIKRGNLGFYKPRRSDGTPGIELNLEDEIYGDMAFGQYKSVSDHREGRVIRDPHPGLNEQYERLDFKTRQSDAGYVPSLPDDAFLVRLRRSDEDFSGDAAVASSGPPVPFLFGRGTAIRDEDGGTDLFNRRERGTIVRATAISSAKPALTVGGAMTPDLVGIAPFAVRSSEWLDLSFPRDGTRDFSFNLPNQSAEWIDKTVVSVGSKLIAGGGVSEGSGKEFFVPIYVELLGVRYVAAFGRAKLAQALDASHTTLSLQKLSGTVAAANASTALLIKPEPIIPEVWDEHLTLRQHPNGELLKAPTLVRTIH